MPNAPQAALLMALLDDMAKAIKPLLDVAMGEPVRVTWTIGSEKGDDDAKDDPRAAGGAGCACARGKRGGR